MPKQTKQHPFLEAMDKYTLTRDDFNSNFKKVLDFVIKLKKYILSEFEGVKKSIAELSSKLESDNTTSVSKLRDDINREVSKALKEQESGMNFMRDKVIGLKDGKPGKDANIKKIVKRVLKEIKLPEQKDMILDTPDTIANKLETLSGPGKLKIDAVLDLEKRLKELEERPIGRGGVMGGGVGKLAFEAKFIDDETPAEVPNGTIVDFVALNKPNPESALEVFADGQRLNLTEDYTLSGNTITFVDAPVTNTIIKFKYRI